MKLKKTTSILVLFLILGSHSKLLTVNAETSSDLQVKINQNTTKIEKIQENITKNKSQLASTITDLNNETTSTENMLRDLQVNKRESNFINLIINSKNLTDLIKRTSAYNTLLDAKEQKINTLNNTKKKVQNLGISLTKDIQEAQALQSELSEQYDIVKKQEVKKLKEQQELEDKQKAEAEKKENVYSEKTSTQVTSNIKPPEVTVNSKKESQIIHNSNNLANGLDMNQTTGTIDIQALANYMSSVTGGDASTWQSIIYKESTGRVDADNGSHYGLFQCDYGTVPPGSNLGKQIEGAIYKYNSQGFYNAWLRWEP